MAMDMTKGKPIKLLITFALPLMLSSILQQLYSVCDSIMVERLIGEQAFAAIGSASYLDWFPLSMIIGLTQGFGVVLATRRGAKDKAGLRRAFAMSLTLASGVAVGITIFGVSFLAPFLRLLKTPEALFSYTLSYLRVMWLGLIITAIQNVCDTMLRAMGDSRTPLISLILSTLLNVAIDILFLAVLRLGVAAAALSTLIAKAAGILFSLWRMKKADDVLPKREDFAPCKETAKTLLRFGLPPMFTFAVTATGELGVQAAFNLRGVFFVTGITAAKRYYTLMNIAGGSLEGSVATFVGQNTGAKQMNRVFDGTRTAVLLSFAASVFISATMIFFREPLIRFFLPASHSQVLKIGMDALRAEVLPLFALSFLCLHRAALQGMGHPLAPMLSGFMELALRFLSIWLLPLFFGNEGLYYIDAVTWIGTCLMLMAVYYTLRQRMQKLPKEMIQIHRQP